MLKCFVFFFDKLVTCTQVDTGKIFKREFCVNKSMTTIYREFRFCFPLLFVNVLISTFKNGSISG